MTVLDSPSTGIFIVCLIFVVAMFMAWSKRRQLGSTKVDKLRSNAKGLKLKLHNTEGYSIFEAVADQLCHLNPHGLYTADIIKNKIRRNWSISFQQVFHRNVNIWKRQEMWNVIVEELHEIADAYKRTIEVVHCDRKETTVIRPVGIEAMRHMQTVYIGYCGQGKFYSLRPEIFIQTADTRTRDSATSKANSNILIGDNTKQYVYHLPRTDDDDEYKVIKNIVVGEKTSQYINATFRTSKELIDFLHNMESSGSNGSNHRLRLKIREKSDTFSNEQLREKHKRIVDLLEDNTSEARRDLEKELEPLGLIYEKASLECILLQLKVQSFKTLCTFVSRFREGDIDNIMKMIACPVYDNTSKYDVKVHLSLNLNIKEREEMSNFDISIYNDQSEEKKTTLKTDSITPSFSVVLRHKSDHNISSEELAEEISEATYRRLAKSLFLDDSSEIDFHFEKYGLLENRLLSKRSSREVILQNASNMISESMKGRVGFIEIENKRTGSCFRVGPRYVMTAYHVVDKVIDDQSKVNCNENMHVEFPDVDEKHLAKTVFFDKNLDVAVLRLASENSERTSLNLAEECRPGLSFYIICYLESLRETRRSVIASTNYSTRSTSAELILFESDNFKYGCSGAPGITIIDGKASMVTMLLGSVVTEKDAWYYGVKMGEVYKQVMKKCPDLAAELFAASEDFCYERTSTHDKQFKTGAKGSQISKKDLKMKRIAILIQKIRAIANKIKNIKKG